MKDASNEFGHVLNGDEPARQEFKRVYKIPAPFHSDLFGEFFEWLYMRR